MRTCNVRTSHLCWANATQKGAELVRCVQRPDHCLQLMAPPVQYCQLSATGIVGAGGLRQGAPSCHSPKVGHWPWPWLARLCHLQDLPPRYHCRQVMLSGLADPGCLLEWQVNAFSVHRQVVQDMRPTELDALPKALGSTALPRRFFFGFSSSSSSPSTPSTGGSSAGAVLARRLRLGFTSSSPPCSTAAFNVLVCQLTAHYNYRRWLSKQAGFGVRKRRTV